MSQRKIETRREQNCGGPLLNRRTHLHDDSLPMQTLYPIRYLFEHMRSSSTGLFVSFARVINQKVDAHFLLQKANQAVHAHLFLSAVPRNN